MPQRRGAASGAAVRSGSGAVAGLRRELGYFSGLVRLSEWRSRGGTILRFQRVRPPRSDRFQPLRASEITPQFLDRALGGLRRWNYDVVAMDDVVTRLAQPSAARRFVSLTFDGGTHDFAEFAYPVLARHGVPFTLYLPTAFPDGLGEAWWLGLEQVIARHERIALMIDDRERRFDTADVAGKYQTYHYLEQWLRSLPPAQLSTAIRDLCLRYAVDLAELTRETAMDWLDINALAIDPNVTIGSATVNYTILANMDAVDARREIEMGRAVMQAALGRDVLHFAYPSGDRRSFGDAHLRMAEEAGFASAVTTLPGVIAAGGAAPRYALPRIDWDGRHPLRFMRAMLAGW